jgi:hypothetical protein
MAVNETDYGPKEVPFLLQLNQVAGLMEDDQFGARYSLRGVQEV